MSEVKGAAIKDTPVFIREHFSEIGFKKWFDSLPEKSQKIYQSHILSSVWYPFEFASEIPIKKLIEIFYFGDPKKAKEVGRFSAERTLSGIYKLFVKLGNPSYVVSKAGTITTTFTRPSKCETIVKEYDHFVIRFTEFPDIYEELEYYILGFMERALEISGCTNIIIKINKSIAKGDKYTEYEGTWQ